MASDADRVARACAGDTGARDAIARDYRERIRRYVTAMVGDPDVAEDLTQECFGKAFAKLKDLRDPARLAPWLYTIAVNKCRRHLAKAFDASHPANSGPLESDPVGGRRSVLSSVVARESAAALAIAIDRLPILLREALVLHVVEGLCYADMAEITGASVAALHVRAHRAKALLKKQLGAVVDTFWVER